MPWYDNATLADAMLRSVVTAENGKAIGMEICAEDSILNQIEVPAAELRLGDWNNARESKLLLQDNYQSVIASAIAATITEQIAAMQ